MQITFQLNGQAQTVDVDGDTPLVWVLRDELDLKGTKYGCGKAACGACTVNVDGKAIRSCSFAVKYAAGKSVTTIEGLAESHPVKRAWTEHIVPQCGYCQPGFMMATNALLNQNPSPSDDEIDRSIINVCRCATYYRMRKAIHRAAELTTENA